MARGDGKAVKGKTRGKLPVKRMLLGGSVDGPAPSNASSMRSGYSGGASTGGNNFGAGGGGLGNSSREGGFGGVSPSRASGASTAGQLARLGDNPSAAMTGAGMDSGRAQMLAGMLNDAAYGPGVKSLTPGGKIADRIAPTPGFRDMGVQTPAGYVPNNYNKPPAPANPMNAFTRQSTQLTAMNSPTGVRGTLGSQYVGSTPASPSAPAAPSAAPQRMSGAQDYASITPGSVALTRTMQNVPFSQSDIGKSLLAQSQQPLTKAQAMALSKQLPPGSQLIGKGLASMAYPTPAGYNPGSYNQYNTTIDGYNFGVSVPKSATGKAAGPTVGSWTGPVGGSATSANRTGAPAPTGSTQATTGSNSGGGGFPQGLADRQPSGSVSASQGPSAGQSASRPGSPVREAAYERGGGRGEGKLPYRRPHKKEAQMASGGIVRRGDGKSRIGTKGKMV